MRFAPLLLACLTALSACTTPTAPVRAINETVTLRFGQPVTVAGEPLKFVSVQDSRCPSTVTCVWEGDAAIGIESGGEVTVLHTATNAGPRSARLNGLNVALVDVKPARVTTEAPQNSEYAVTVHVTH